MKICILLAAVMLSACQPSEPRPKILTLSEMEHFQKDCSKSVEQLKQLKYNQNAKNFSENPDDLNDEDRVYNRALKDNIWWFTYTCNQS